MRAPGAESGQIFNLLQEQFTPRIVRNLLLEAPLVGDAILGNQSTLRLRCDSWTKAEADGRFLRTSDLGPLDARYFPVAPGAEAGGIFNLIQTQFTPKIIRNLLCQTPLSAQPILGNGSTLQISCDCWSKGQSDTRYPLIANFNSLGQRVTDLENSATPPTADITVNSLTATSYVETPELRSGAGDLQIQNALVTIRKEDGALLASFADGGISLDRDVTRPAPSMPPRRISPSYCSQTVLASECCSSHLWISNVMFEPSEMNASQTACACYKWTSSGTLFSHSGVNSTEHGMFDDIGPVRHKTLFLPLVEKLV